MTTVLELIVSTLKAAGYIVNITPQEKQMMAAKELIILLKDMDVEVESNVTYVVRPRLILRFQDTSVDSIIKQSVKLMKKVEECMTSNMPFKFETPKIDQLGSVYIVELMFMYTDIVKIDD